MTLPAIGALEQQLRDAVSAGSFSAVPSLLNSYCREVEVRARQLAPDDPRFTELAARFHSTAHWIRLMASATRARCGDELHKADLVHEYLTSEPKDHTALSLDL